MRIDKEFVYHERNKYVGNGAYGMLIARYWTSKNYLDVQLKIDGKDTVFKYDLTKCNCDSLMISSSQRLPASSMWAKTDKRDAAVIIAQLLFLDLAHFF